LLWLVVMCMISNTGMSWGAKYDDFPEKDGWDRLISTNVKSVRNPHFPTMGLIELERLT
jgi:hypothetical protein